MKINYSKNDNNRKIKGIKINKTAKKIIIGAFAMMLTVGTGMENVKAQALTTMKDLAIDTMQQILDSDNQKMFENGYNFYKTGDGKYVDNVDWDIEKSIYFNKGIQNAVELGEEMVEGIKSPEYSINSNYSEMSTPELMVNAKRVYDVGLEYAETGILNSIGDPALEELKRRGIEFDPVQGGVNYYEAQGNERHAPISENSETLSKEDLEKWEQYGEKFFTTGDFPSNEEWDYDTKNTNNLAGKVTYFNKGLEKAIDDGKQIVSGTFEINYDNISEMSNKELLEVLAAENWFELGVEYQKSGVLPDKIVDGSMVDKILKSRGINISASKVFQAGCNSERLKQIENVKTIGEKEEHITKDDIKQIVSDVSLSDIMMANEDLQKLINDKEINENKLEI